MLKVVLSRLQLDHKRRSRSGTSRSGPHRLPFLDEDRCRLSITFALVAHRSGLVDHIVFVLT